MRFFISIAVITISFSCSTTAEKDIELMDYTRLDTAIYFAGSWLSEDYYNSILKFKSPKKAQEGAEFIVIPDRTLKQTIMIYGFHEGGPFLNILKNKNEYEVWEMEGDSLASKQYNIEMPDDSTIKLGKKTFVRISASTDTDNYKILENILFQGIYTNEQGKTVEFKMNGDITGIENIQYYEPRIDYFDAGMQVDQIGLGSSEKNLQWHGFKFNNDTLEIYRLDCLTFDSTTNSCVEVGYGAPEHKLWRKK